MMVQLAPPSAGLPKLRSDLVRSQQDGGVVLKDPASRRFFRFGEAENFIASQLDGVTSVEVIRQRAQERFGTEPAPGAVEGFVATLRRVGLLEAEGAPAAPHPAGPGPFRGSLLYFRLKAFDPDRLLDRLVGKVRFFFTPHFLGFSAAVILLGLGIAVTSRGEFGRDVLRLFNVETLVLAWVTILAVTVIHEFAHCLTCKHFGGHVHEMGFLLLYFQPAFYSNVSDAWLFPERSRRLWVTFAGPYFELFLWALAILTWRVMEPGSWFSAAALVVMATSGIKLFFNLNPLIKLDGYYLLSDYLGIPNLRARAFGYLRAVTKRVWGSASRDVQEVTPRERRIYLAYGLLAGTYSAWLLGYVAVAFGSFLLDRYQGVGFFLYTGLLALMFRNPLKKALGKVPGAVRRSQGRLASILRPAVFLICLAAGLALIFLVRMDLRVVGEFTVLPIHNADIRAEVEGLIEEIYADEGALVPKGAPIARLADREYRAELRKVEAEIDEKRAKLKMLKAGPRPEEIALQRKAGETAATRREHMQRRYEEAERIRATRLSRAKTDLAKVEEQLKYARNDLARSTKLFTENLIARKQLEEAEERVTVREKELESARAEVGVILSDDLAEVRKDLAVAQKEVEEADTKLKLLLAGSRSEEIEVAQAEIARLEAHRRYLSEQLERVRVVSPITGVVTTPKLKEKIGQHVKKGDLIAEVHEMKTIKAEIAISEKDIGEVKVGRPVVLKARGFPEESFAGIVTEIAPAAKPETEAWRGKVFRVTTEIDNTAGLLRPEMTGNAKIFCGDRRIVDLLTRKLVRYVRVEFWSWWWW